MALYEHRTFCLGVLYGLNSFDQPGVELGKKLAIPIEEALRSDSDVSNLHPVTAQRIQWFKKPNF
jgi:glucose-6-phosphate isomerase